MGSIAYFFAVRGPARLLAIGLEHFDLGALRRPLEECPGVLFLQPHAPVRAHQLLRELVRTVTPP